MKVYFQFICALFLLSSVSSIAQQNDDIKFNYDNLFLRNPAATSGLYEMVGSVNYIKQFSGIERAPTTMFAAFQYPIPYQELSLGLGIMNESAGLLSNNSVNLTASYKLRSVLTNKDYLAMGLTFRLSQLSVSGLDIEVVNSADPFSVIGNEDAIGFNVGYGVFYSNRRYRDLNDMNVLIQVGLSSIKALPQNLNFQSISIDEVSFYQGIINLIQPLSKDGSRIQSLFEIFYERSNLINLSLSGQYIHRDAFIIGLSADMNYDLGFNAGVQFSPSFTDGYYRIVGYAVIPMGLIDNSVNSGFGVNVTYGFDTSYRQ